MEKGFNTVREFVKSIPEFIREGMASSFRNHEPIIVKYQQSQLYDKGEDSKGSMIRPAYTPFTVRMKRKKGQPTDRVTWKDTGKLYKSIEVIVRGDEAEINVFNVPYYKKLVEKYGSEVIGIQEELLKDFVNNYVVPDLKKVIDDKLSKY